MADPVISVSCEVPKATNHFSAQHCSLYFWTIFTALHMSCEVPQGINQFLQQQNVILDIDAAVVD